MDNTQGLQEKIKLLKDELRTYDRIAIAFSGGVDSTFLLLVAHSVLGAGALAVTATGPQFAPDEIQEAKEMCEKYEIPQLVLNIENEVMPYIADNPEDRCYICKRHMFEFIPDALGEFPIADGSNADDLLDYRPGRRALRELGIISPLEDIGFTKDEIRTALVAMNVPTWNKPAYACLATRIPTGDALTREKMEAVYRAEHALRQKGIAQVRVRHHGDVARIEVAPEERRKFYSDSFMDQVNQIVKQAGFKYAALDLGGYVKGSMNK
ncbi:MAG: ATP-dependent sacrificial sulfur transferase LarE [Anaerovoracaceae bacterium]